MRLGLGSLSLPLSIISLTFSLISLPEGKMGEVILNSINLRVPYGLISIVLLLLAFAVGKKYSYHRFADLGKKISLFSVCAFIAVLVINIIFALF